MVFLDDKDVEFIKKHIDNSEEILRSNDVGDVLEAIDIYIMVHGFDEDYELTDVGRQAQRIYDNIYKNN